MNSNHDRVCPSPEWAEYLQSEVLPQATDRVDLGQTMLEIGPGPGASTELKDIARSKLRSSRESTQIIPNQKGGDLCAPVRWGQPVDTPQTYR